MIGQHSQCLERGALVRGNIGELGVLTALQDADVSDNSPAILRLNLRGVIGHGAEPIGDHIEEVADWRGAKPVDVIGGWPSQTSPDYHAQPRASAVMARRAVNIEALLSALEKKLRQGQEIALLHVVRAVSKSTTRTWSLPAPKKPKSGHGSWRLLQGGRRGTRVSGDVGPPCGPEIGEGIAW